MSSPLLEAIQGVFESVPMPAQSGHNTHENYRYSTRDDLFEAIRDAMVRNGVLWFPQVDIVNFEEAPPTYKGKPQFRTQVKCEITLAHPDDSNTVTFGWVGESVTTTDRGAAMAGTTAIRQAIINWMMLTGTDPEEASRQQRQSNVREPTSSSPAPEPEPVDNSGVITKLKNLIRDAHNSATAEKFVTEYIPWVESKSGVDLPIERFPEVRLERWHEKLEPLDRDVLREKVITGLRKMEAAV